MISRGNDDGYFRENHFYVLGIEKIAEKIKEKIKEKEKKKKSMIGK